MGVLDVCCERLGILPGHFRHRADAIEVFFVGEGGFGGVGGDGDGVVGAAVDVTSGGELMSAL